MKTKLRYADVYLRLSNDEKNGGESESILNQRSIINKYCDDNGIFIVKEFVDDGYSGANFERPGFQALLKHLDSGLVNTVITKDLSRLGRDMTESSYFSEKYFPEHGIQFITVSDNYNSDNPAPFSSLQFAINDYYLRETSHKINQVLKHKREAGEYCACPPFGYMKEFGKRGQLIPDPETAPIVQKIFQLASDGKSSHGIAETLTEKGYITPLKYRATRRDTFTEKGAARASDAWNHTTVKRILRNKVYLGHTVLGKTKKVSLKSKKKFKVPEEEWVITKNTHQALVSQDMFDKAQYYIGMNTKRWDSHPQVRKSVFSGIVFCANCGAAMCSGGTVYNGERDKYWYLVCNNITRKDEKKCEHGARIKYSDLLELIKKELNELIKLSDSDIDEIIKSIPNSCDEDLYEGSEEQIKIAQKRLLEIDKIIDKLYVDNISGIIDDERLSRMIKSLTDESNKIKEQINDVDKVVSEKDLLKNNYKKFFELIKQYTEINELTEDIIRTFIDRIEIYPKVLPEGYKVASHKNSKFSQKIVIRYKFIGNSTSKDVNIDIQSNENDAV